MKRNARTCFATTYQSYHLSIQLIPFKGVRTPSTLGFQLGDREAIDAILAALRMAGTALDLGASPKRPRQVTERKKCHG